MVYAYLVEEEIWKLTLFKELVDFKFLETNNISLEMYERLVSRSVNGFLRQVVEFFIKRAFVTSCRDGCDVTFSPIITVYL